MLNNGEGFVKFALETPYMNFSIFDHIF